MWVKTCGDKLVNMSLIDMVGIVQLSLSDRYNVEAVFAGGDNDSSVILYVGTFDDCEKYMVKLGDTLKTVEI